MRANHRPGSFQFIGFLPAAAAAAIAIAACADKEGSAQASSRDDSALALLEEASRRTGAAPGGAAGSGPGAGGTSPGAGAGLDAGVASPGQGTTTPGAVTPLPDCRAPSGAYLPGVPVTDVYLRAEPCEIPANTFDNPTRIRMWGFIQTDATFTAPAGARVQVPGPAIAASAGTSLTVHLKNNLAGPYVEPVSMVIRGQTSVMTPVFIDPATGSVTSTGARLPNDYKSRVRSFAAEAAPGAVAVYTFTNLRPGTFLYQSGTHPAVQMQMGLYGALIVYPPITGQAYEDPVSAYQTQAAILFSEIDSVFHAAIADGKYGPNPLAPNAPPPGWRTSTIAYHPDYSLINGLGYTARRPLLAGATADRAMLLRLLNAGLTSRVPELSGPVLDQGGSSVISSTRFLLIAEDANFIQITTPVGNAIAAPRSETGLLLAAGQTLDALITPHGRGDLAVMDRRLNLTNAGVSPGGQLALLSVSGGAGGPVLHATPSPVGFGSVAVGQTKTLVITLQNQGLIERVVQSVQIAGTTIPSYAGDYAATLTPPLTIPAGGSATFPVSFHPGAIGARPAKLLLGTNDPSSPTLTLPLSGTGQ